MSEIPHAPDPRLAAMRRILADLWADGVDCRLRQSLPPSERDGAERDLGPVRGCEEAVDVALAALARDAQAEVAYLCAACGDIAHASGFDGCAMNDDQGTVDVPVWALDIVVRFIGAAWCSGPYGDAHDALKVALDAVLPPRAPRP